MIVSDAGSKSGIRAVTAALVLCSIFPPCSPCCLCRNTLHKKIPSWTCLSCVLTHVTAHILLSFVSAWRDTPFPQGICHNRTSMALYFWQREKFLKILTIKQGFSLLSFCSPEHTLWLILRCGDPLPRSWFPHTFIHTDGATFCFHPCSPWPKKSGEGLAKMVNKGKNAVPGSLKHFLSWKHPWITHETVQLAHLFKKRNTRLTKASAVSPSPPAALQAFCSWHKSPQGGLWSNSSEGFSSSHHHTNHIIIF